MLRATVTVATLTAGGCSIFYVVLHKLRDAVRYYGRGRRGIPPRFWLYLSLCVICGTLSFTLGVYCLINHSQIFDVR